MSLHPEHLHCSLVLGNSQERGFVGLGRTDML